MKATELQIGDWVKPKNVDTSFRVGLIGADSVWNDTDTHEWYYDELEPIPLTAEILEKNGFRIIFEGELHTTYFQDIEGFHVEIKIDCINYIKLSMLNGLGYNITIECKFVHQLQHALRLCGISKEIEL